MDDLGCLACSSSSLLPLPPENLLYHLNTCARDKVSSPKSLGLSLNAGEDMDICKCIVPSRHVGTLNSHRAASLLVRLVEGVERWETFDPPIVFSLLIGVELSKIVLSPAMVLENRLKILALHREELRGP
ncbi:hypothetical protein TNCV_4063151 [Trichonephila clavipes]|nr:hypothetical protein TNCV_4063151 [Trichonephila clavipes]